jgi:hypothetical protein
MIERIGVVVPVYKEAGLINTAETLMAQELPADIDLEVVFVNNDADDPELAGSPGVRELERAVPNLTIITEEQPGTGAACDTGVRHLREVHEVDLILRTDGDVLVVPRWADAARQYLDAHPEKQLVHGPSLARQDDGHFLAYDEEGWPRFWDQLRGDVADLLGDEFYRHTPPGHNMGFRSEVYERVQFGRTNIGEADEDMRFARELWDLSPDNLIGFVDGQIAFHSMRRVRALQGDADDPAVGYDRMRQYYTLPRDGRAQNRAAMMPRGDIDYRG